MKLELIMILIAELVDCLFVVVIEVVSWIDVFKDIFERFG